MLARSAKGVFLALICLACSSCAMPFERYMKEGHKFLEEKNYAKARESFHKAVLEARADMPKKSERLLEALLAEKDCAADLKQNDDALRLLAEAVNLLRRNKEFKRAAMLESQMGVLNDPSLALECYEAALTDLKNARLGMSPETAEVFAAIADLKSSQNDYKAAARYLENACELLDRIKYASNDHAHAIYLHKLAFIYQQLDRDDDALAAGQKAKKFEMSGIDDSVGRIPKL